MCVRPWTDLWSDLSVVSAVSKAEHPSVKWEEKGYGSFGMKGKMQNGAWSSVEICMNHKLSMAEEEQFRALVNWPVLEMWVLKCSF